MVFISPDRLGQRLHIEKTPLFDHFNDITVIYEKCGTIFCRGFSQHFVGRFHYYSSSRTK